MKVLVLFDPLYTGAPTDAVWIIESAENRKWFERHAPSIDPNSAVFNADNNVLDILWHVFDHHPTWTDIEVRGPPLTKEAADEISADAALTITNDGFRLSRL